MFFVRNGHVVRQCFIQQTFGVFNESVDCWFWPGCIIPQIQEVAKVFLFFQIEIGTGNNLQEEDVSGNDSRACIIYMEIKGLDVSAANSSDKKIPQVLTSQKEDLSQKNKQFNNIV